MELEVVPPLDEAERRAVTVALARANIGLHELPPGYRSTWRSAELAELAEPTEEWLGADRYARSPRRTPGATRA